MVSRYTHFTVARIYITDGRPSVALALAGFAHGLNNYRGADGCVIIPEVPRARVLTWRRIVLRWTVTHFDYLRSCQVVGLFRSHHGGVQRDFFQTATVKYRFRNVQTVGFCFFVFWMVYLRRSGKIDWIGGSDEYVFYVLQSNHERFSTDFGTRVILNLPQRFVQSTFVLLYRWDLYCIRFSQCSRIFWNFIFTLPYLVAGPCVDCFWEMFQHYMIISLDLYQWVWCKNKLRKKSVSTLSVYGETHITTIRKYLIQTFNFCKFQQPYWLNI